MEKVTLKAAVREELKKCRCNQLRKGGNIPAVVYKSGKIGTNIQVNDKDLKKVLHTEAGENVIITLNIEEGGKTSEKTVIVQDIQKHPISEKMVHVDFHEISLTEKIKVNVPIAIKGEAVGVSEEKGILTQIIWEIEVECLPTDIPEHLYVRVEGLHIGEAIHVKELEAPAGVTILEDPDAVVVSVTHQAAEEAEEKVEGEEPEGEEPELIKKGKKEEDGEAEEKEEEEKEGKEKKK